MNETMLKLNKGTKNTEEFMSTLNDLRKISKDYLVEPTKMAILPADKDLSIAFKDKEFLLTETAKKQLAFKLKIPYSYFSMLLENGHENLLLKNINELIRFYHNPLLIRTTDEQARAVLSNKYKRMDNLEVAENILNNNELGDVKIKSMSVNLDQMFIKFIAPTIQGEIEKGDIVNAGFMVSNSETGLKMLRTYAYYERLVCKNGMVSPEITSGFQKRHLGKYNYLSREEIYREMPNDRYDEYDLFELNKEITTTLKDAINTEKFYKALNKLKALKNEEFKATPQETVKALSKKYAFTTKEKELVLHHYIDDSARDGLNAFGLVNAVTRTAQDIENYDRANKFEEIGGILNNNIKEFVVYLNTIIAKKKEREETLTEKEKKYIMKLAM